MAMATNAVLDCELAFLLCLPDAYMGSLANPLQALNTYALI